MIGLAWLIKYLYFETNLLFPKVINSESRAFLKEFFLDVISELSNSF
jgi:hypothetical protein